MRASLVFGARCHIRHETTRPQTFEKRHLLAHKADGVFQPRHFHPVAHLEQQALLAVM